MGVVRTARGVAQRGRQRGTPLERKSLWVKNMGSETEGRHSMEQTKTVYETTWRNKFLTLEAKTIEEMAALLRSAASRLEQMARCGITLDPKGGTGDDYARLVTTDPLVAKEFGLEAEPCDEEDGEGDPASVC